MGGTDFRLWVSDPDHVIWNAVVSDKVRGWPRTQHKAVTVHRKGDNGEPMPRSLVHGLPYSGPYWRLTH